VRLLAHRIAVRLPSGATITRDDLISYGSIGLLEAFDHYQPSYGIRFGTYAEHRIRGAMLDALRAEDPLSRRQRTLARQIEEAARHLAHEEGGIPEPSAIAERLGLPLEVYYRAKESLTASQPLSLVETEPSDDKPGLPRAQLPPASGSEEVISDLLRKDTLRVIQRALAKLSPRRRQLAEYYYLRGLGLAQIGEIVGLSTSRVSQILKEARGALGESIKREARAQGLSWRETIGRADA